MRVLLLEDDIRLNGAFGRRLEAGGMAVDPVYNLRQARAAIADVEYDCLVFDRFVPDGDALDLVDELHRQGNQVPILVVSALGDGDQRILGLEAGADDYLPKPVRLDELTIRVRKLAARHEAGATACTRIEVGRVVLDRDRASVTVDGEAVHLTPTQYGVVELMIVNRHRMTATDELLEHCWNGDRDLFANPLHSQITRLRRIFKGVLGFRSVRGAGYILVVDGEPRSA